jgi:hypothetical protein
MIPRGGQELEMTSVVNTCGRAADAPLAPAAFFGKNGKDLLKVMPVLTEPLPARLYHYTSLEVLMKIVKTGEMWATDAAYMNDTSELVYGQQIIQSAIDARQRQHQAGAQTSNTRLERWREAIAEEKFQDLHVHAVCFCATRDSVSQWRAYGDRGGGAALVFDGQQLQSLLSKNADLCTGRVEYDPNRQAELAASVIEYGLSVKGEWTGFAGCVLLEPFLKAPVFKEEAEWRIVRLHRSDEGVEFRVARGNLIPYSTIDLRRESNQPPLCEVIVGPTVNEDAALMSMERFLQSRGCKNVKVSPSAVPLRF